MGNACAPKQSRRDDFSRNYVHQKKGIEDMQAEFNFEIASKGYDARSWDIEYEQWMAGKCDKPASHPDPDHWWNKNPELHQNEKRAKSKNGKKVLEKKELEYR